MEQYIRVYNAMGREPMTMLIHTEEEATLLEILADSGIITYEEWSDEIIDTKTYKKRTKGEYYR